MNLRADDVPPSEFEISESLMEETSREMFVVTLDNDVKFVWRSEMTCLVPVDEGRLIRDFRPGDEVLFNKKQRVITSIYEYG